MQSNVSVMAAQQLRVADVPGHPRIRDQYRDYMGDARGIAFVVDSSTVSRNGAMVAEYVRTQSLVAMVVVTYAPIPDTSTKSSMLSRLYLRRDQRQLW